MSTVLTLTLILLNQCEGSRVDSTDSDYNTVEAVWRFSCRHTDSAIYASTHVVSPNKLVHTDVSNLNVSYEISTRKSGKLQTF